MSAARWRTYLDRFSSLKALVIGDLMLDHYVWGAVSRISPEAPVPVVEVNRETEMPGGAGNVASNMAVLGAQVSLVGLVGQDSAAQRLVSLLQSQSIQTDLLLDTSERPTILKTRIFAHHQQVVRVDHEKKGPLGSALRQKLAERIATILPTMDVVILSDYGKGVLSLELIAPIVREARRCRIPVLVDPKLENFRFYKQITSMTPNLKEAMEGGGVHKLERESDLEKLGQTLLNRLKADSVLITRGEKGMSLFERGRKPFHIPTRAREVFDVTGAGDTVISTLSLALAAGAPLRIAAEMANYAAGIVVGKVGASSVSVAELWEVLKDHA